MSASVVENILETTNEFRLEFHLPAAQHLKQYTHSYDREGFR